MNKSNLNISNIENYLFTLFDNNVSNNTCIGTLPDTLPDTWQDMVLIDFGTQINDFDAMRKCIVHIFLYAKPLSNGTKNLKAMSQLEQKFDTALAKQTSKIYRLNHAYDDSGFDSEVKWHYVIKALNLLIF